MTRRKRRRPSRRGQFELDRGLISVLLSVVTALLTVVALITEWGMLWALTGMTAAVTAAQIHHTRQQRKHAKARAQANRMPAPKRPAQPRPQRARNPRAGDAPAPAARPLPKVIKCTETRLPTDECQCRSRHIVTWDGVDRYGKPLGSPLGPKGAAKGGAVVVRKPKEPRVPTTNNARPIEQPDGSVLTKDPNYVPRPALPKN